ncbi:MAG: NFACT family protein [Thermoplasmata archaeon]|nr:NFACT family protein [Candidatus Thermoplasmatota archaeon]MCK4948831.1 NFACT family protein [Thermoplasmata archaeon]
MKKEMTSFDIMVMSAELQKLIGSYVEKIYQPQTNRLHFRFNIPGSGKENLIVNLGKWIHLDPAAEPPGKTLSYGMFLRKYLINGKVIRIQQRKFDRIVEFTIDRRSEFQLVLEMFGKGNVILIKDGMILQPLHSKSWSGRELRAHKEYGFPPERTDAPRLSQEEVLSIITSSEKDLVRALAVDVNLGGVYAEELCYRTGMDKNVPAKDLEKEVADSLLAAFAALLDEISHPTPTVVFDENVPADVLPIGLRKYEGLRQEERETFSEAISEYLEGQPKEIKDERVAKLERRRKQQEEALQKHKEKAVESHEIANFMYTHYELMDGAIQTLRSEESPSGVELLSRDPKRKAAVIRLEGREIEVHFEEDLNANAQRYYVREKTAKSKIRSLGSRIEETERELELADKRKEKEVEKREPTKGLWVDRFRWFLSSEEFLVLGGRDAKSNEKVVKKHLEPGDRYIHADMSGAPSIVVKKGSEAGEDTLREACQFALSFSKAWSKGLASGSAYWVNPEQVSKRAESGEYLPRGGFMIRGRRNYVHKLPLEVAVGEISYEGARKIVCGPPEAVKRHSESVFIFAPGRENPNKVAKDLSEHYNVPIEEVLRILPPGGLERTSPA